MRNVLLVPILLMSVMLAGCGSLSKGKAETTAHDAVVEPDRQTTTDSGEGASSSGLSDDGRAGTRAFGGSDGAADSGGRQQQVHVLDEPGSLLGKRVVYFDFDKSDIKGEFRDIIAAHARYLSDNPSASVTLEGHADERGSREYNIALGERRAKAVQQMMLLQGAAKSQFSLVSYGEERPAALGHEESSWRLNRRVQIVYTRR